MPPKARKTVRPRAPGPLQGLRDKVETMYDAIFGRWDRDDNRQVPGMRDDIKGIKDQMRLLRYGLIALGFLVSFGTAKAVGIPTQHIGEGAQFVWQYVQYALTHPSPP